MDIARAQPADVPVMLVMGVSGAGKTAVASRLALALDGVFLEADDFHSPENIAAMSAGRPLTDAMRQPWLKSICAAARAHADKGEVPVVIACSALKRSYRDLMRSELGIAMLIYLDADQTVLTERMQQRGGHFMPVSLLASQLATLEVPDPCEDPLVVDVRDELDVINSTILAGWRARLARQPFVKRQEIPQ
jgi:gluconokinase